VALLNEVPKELPVHGEIAALAKSVKASEAILREVVAGLEVPERKKLADCQFPLNCTHGAGGTAGLRVRLTSRTPPPQSGLLGLR